MKKNINEIIYVPAVEVSKSRGLKDMLRLGVLVGIGFSLATLMNNKQEVVEASQKLVSEQTEYTIEQHEVVVEEEFNPVETTPFSPDGLEGRVTIDGNNQPIENSPEFSNQEFPGVISVQEVKTGNNGIYLVNGYVESQDYRTQRIVERNGSNRNTLTVMGCSKTTTTSNIKVKKVGQNYVCLHQSPFDTISNRVPYIKLIESVDGLFAVLQNGDFVKIVGGNGNWAQETEQGWILTY